MEHDHLTPRYGQWLSPGLRALGLPVTLRAFREWTQYYPGSPVLSVGSGTGLLEMLCKEQDANLTLLCVDPKPLSFLSDALYKPFLEPDFPTVSEVPREFIGKCLVYLGWPDPFVRPYDHDAVTTLKPLSFLTLIEGHGAAGSEDFLEFLEETTEYVLVREINVDLPFPDGVLMIQLQQWDLVEHGHDQDKIVTCEYQTTKLVRGWANTEEHLLI